MRIDSSGNVGIGTASPSSRLDVRTTAAEIARFSSSATNGGYQIFYPDNVVTPVYVGSQKAILATGNATDFAIVGTGANNMVFGTNSTERMRIDTSGNVGIGVTPTVNLDVKNAGGNCVISAQFGTGTKGQLIAASNEVQLKAFNGTNDVLTFATGASERMRIDSSGNVGIGMTPSTDTLFEVYGAAAATCYKNVNTGTGLSDGFYVGCGKSSSTDAYVYNRESAPIIFGTANAERMRITSGGEVYIAGTTDQGAYNLQCNGTGVWGAGAYVNGSDARLKDDITTLNDGLNVVSQLRPVTFKYKPDYSKDQNVQTGFIAQELQAVLAGKNYVDGVVQTGPNHLNVAYQSLIPILVKAIQELTARVAELEAK